MRALSYTITYGLIYGGRALGSNSPLLNSSYVEVEFGQARADIEAYSLATFQYVADAAWHPFGYLESGLSQLAEWDIVHGTRLFQTPVHYGLGIYAERPGPCDQYWQMPLINDYNDFVAWSAIGAITAHIAYDHPVYMTWARNAFQFITDHGYISTEDIRAGYLKDTKTMKVELRAECDGESMVGGVFWQNGCPAEHSATRDPKVDAVSTGGYALLGASLCRLTGNMTYCDYAYSALGWMGRLLSKKGLISSHIYGNSCIRGPGVTPYNSALYLAAYAELGNITNNASALAIARDIAVTAMTTDIWNNEEGIITEGVGSALTEQTFFVTFGPVLIRYLHRSFKYFDSDVQQAILDYFNIQYWAITQKDSTSQIAPLLYGRNWTGPGYEVATNETVIAALDVLTAITLNPDSAFPTVSNKSAKVAMLAAPAPTPMPTPGPPNPHVPAVIKFCDYFFAPIMPARFCEKIHF